MPACFASFIRFQLAALAVVVLAASAAFAEAPREKPNFVFLFADDFAYEAVGFMGNDEVRTPHLDRLAERGTVFTHAYNQGGWNGAVCVASRAMLNTGRFIWHANGVNPEKERQAGRFWSEHLRQAGYETFITGKWHVHAKAGEAFDHAVHVRGGMPGSVKTAYNRPLEGRPDTWKPWNKKIGGFWSGGKHWSEVTADDAIGFLDQATSSDARKPFFMYIAFNAPHDPRQSPQSYVDKFPADKIAVPKSFLPEYPFCRDIGCGPDLRDERLAPFPRTEHAVQVHRAEYYAIIHHLDDQIGRIVAALEAGGQADNTYIVFTADHGLAVGQHGLMGKQNMYEHSLRVPFLIVGPEATAGERIEAPIYLQDIMPTTLELAGIERPEHVEFHSLLPQLRGEQTESSYDAIYGAYINFQRAVIDDGYKLILYPKIGKARLYHLEKDPLELKDLAEQPETLDRQKQLFAKLLELQKATGDELDLAVAFPKLAGE